MNLEHQLTEALGRQEPPSEVIDRVMARIAARDVPIVGPLFWHAHSTGLRLAGGTLLVVIIGLAVFQQREAQIQQQRAESAAQQLRTALRIASETLNDAQRIVRP